MLCHTHDQLHEFDDRFHRVRAVVLAEESRRNVDGNDLSLAFVDEVHKCGITSFQRPIESASEESVDDDIFIFDFRRIEILDNLVERNVGHRFEALFVKLVVSGKMFVGVEQERFHSV